ncbi:MAG: hypothetical protein LUQ02_01235 [Methanothrix sp.]|nr:hypothetical protein [Methanothrix sp.]OYV13965.1 MAG: hypothetical protein CG445_247 [Methanosaeta sp. ASM2]
MTSSEDRIFFDPEKVRFDLSLKDAFALTSVRSLGEFLSLKESLPHLRGQSYFFVNILGSHSRLILTIITAEEQETIATYELDPCPLGIAPGELISAGSGSGNFPLPPHLVGKIKRAIYIHGCNPVRMSQKN